MPLAHFFATKTTKTIATEPRHENRKHFCEFVLTTAYTKKTTTTKRRKHYLYYIPHSYSFVFSCPVGRSVGLSVGLCFANDMTCLFYLLPLFHFPPYENRRYVLIGFETKKYISAKKKYLCTVKWLWYLIAASHTIIYN